MSYYPPGQGGYGYPYPPPQQQYAAGAPIPGYPMMPQQQPQGPPQPGYYPPQGPPPGTYPVGAPGYGYYPQPQGSPAAPPAGAYGGYPSPAGPPPMQPAPTMPITVMAPAPTMMVQQQPSYFAPGQGGPVPTPQQDAETIHAACKGFGTDERRVISVVGKVKKIHVWGFSSFYFLGKKKKIPQISDTLQSRCFLFTCNSLQDLGTSGYCFLCL